MEKNYYQLRKKLIGIVREIVSNSFCLNCDSDSINVECQNCGFCNEKLEKLYYELNSILFDLKKYFEIYKNELSLILFPLRNYNINELNYFSFNFEEEILNNINLIENKIENNVQLSKGDIEYLSIVFGTQFIYSEVICNYVILECLNKNNIFDENVISSVICLLAENMFDSKKMNLRCLIDEFDDVLGLSRHNIVKINYSEIKDFMEGNIDTFFTLFHEYVHVLQYYRQVVLQQASVDDIKQIKEHIILEHNVSFYDDNKFLCSFEQEANILGNVYLLKYFDNIGYPIVSIEEIKRVVNTDFRYNTNDYIISSDDKILLDDEFLNNVTLKDFDLYPQLSYEYKIYGFKVALKTLDEIYSDVEYINECSEFDSVDKKNLMDIYKDIISRYPVKKKKK